MLEEALELYDTVQDKVCEFFEGYNFVALLKASTKLQNLEIGVIIHSDIERRGLIEKNGFLGTSLLDLYAKCGTVTRAMEIFERLQVRDVISWNTLISGHTYHGRLEEAFAYYEKMQLEGVLPTTVTFLCILKACSLEGAVQLGLEIHAEITKLGFMDDTVMLNSTLLDMYAKCGHLAEATYVFRQLPERDVISWTALMAGFVEYGHYERAFNCFEQMLSEGICPDASTYVCSLRACSIMKAMVEGQQIHADIKAKGLEGNPFVGTALIDFYTKCGFQMKAQEIFEMLPARDAVIWNALIAGYLETGFYEKALKFLVQMKNDGIVLDAPLCISGLRTCGSLGAIDQGQEIHAEVERLGLLENVKTVGSALVDMYARCGCLTKAQEVFDKMPFFDVLSWNALIGGHVEHGHNNKVFRLFENMISKSVSPDSSTYALLLKACGSAQNVEKGIELHTEIERKELVERDIFVGDGLVNMYMECGYSGKSLEVFERLPSRDTVSWGVLIAGYADCDHVDEALESFSKMQSEGVFPDISTLIAMLKVCSSVDILEKGQAIHSYVEKHRLLDIDPIIGSALINMYAKCGFLSKAQQILDDLPVQEISAWNALMMGCTEHGYYEEAFDIYRKLQLREILVNPVTYVCIMKVCGSLRAIDTGRQIHAEVAKNGMLHKNLSVGNALVDMYTKCGYFTMAKKVFDNLPTHDVVSWTAVISGYADSGDGDEALLCFDKMQSEGTIPNEVTLVCVLKACGSIGAIDRGQYLHAEVERKGLLESDPMVGSAIVDLYARCGLLHLAQEVFDKLPARVVTSWNILISGYVQMGKSENVFPLYERMIREGIHPDPVTFLIILNACNRTDLLDGSCTVFEIMTNNFGFLPMLEHHYCVLDLFFKRGQFNKATTVIKKIPLPCGLELWQSMLGVCKSLGHVELGTEAFEKSHMIE
ncbi:hypothetical protein KP509_21G030500 [Ceratopteris richardii]|nr:hypothetical protein KP509_21G030500 [Ceratopteris richardii]